MMPDAQKLIEICEATWIPAKTWQDATWTYRDGQGGGKRVSATTLHGDLVDGDIARAETAMRDMGQEALFMIREEDQDLDQALEAAGYRVVDPVTLYAAPIDLLTDIPLPPVTAFQVWEPLAIMVDIWAEAGIGPERLNVMRRATCKTGLFSRWNEKPGGVGFVAIHDGIAMVHALEIRPHQQRQGVGAWMMRAAAFWAAEQGATHISCLCVDANDPANGFYRKLGFSKLGRYHYRQK